MSKPHRIFSVDKVTACTETSKHNQWIFNAFKADFISCMIPNTLTIPYCVSAAEHSLFMARYCVFQRSKINSFLMGLL